MTMIVITILVVMATEELVQLTCGSCEWFTQMLATIDDFTLGGTATIFVMDATNDLTSGW